jgi:hypothetical protein
MPIILDTITRGEYLALTTASSRASLVVSALPAPVVCEVYDGQDVLRASGTMAGQWATASGATVTVGEVTAQGIDVLSGGSPDANWYCQFRSGTRFVRGTFGVLGSGRDFVWSLASFQTGSRGVLGTVSVTAQGASDPVNGGPIVLTAPSISTFKSVGSNGAGTIYRVTPAYWQNPYNYTLSGTVSSGNVIGPGQFYVGPSGSPTSGAYIGYFLTWGGMSQPRVGTVTAYNGTTKVATVSWASGDASPIVGREWRLFRDYPVLSSWQWRRNGVAIPGAIDLVYTATDGDIGAAIFVEESAGNISPTNNGSVKEIPSALSVVPSSPVVITGSPQGGNAIDSASDFTLLGSFRLEQFTGTGVGLVPASLSANGQPGIFVFDGSGGAGEFTFPTFSPNTTWGTLPAPTRIRPTGINYAAVFEGKYGSGINPGNGFRATGACVIPGTSRMLLSSGSPYADGAFAQNRRWSFVTRPANSTTTGDVRGPFVLYDPLQPNSRWMSGTISEIPVAHRDALGGDLIVSGAPLSIHSNLSQGPCGAVTSGAAITAAEAKLHSGTSQGGTSTTITLASGASSVPDFYKDCFVIAPGVYLNRITAYNGTTKVATVEESGMPTGSVAYTIAPGVATKQLLGYADNQLFGDDDERGFAPIWDNINSSIHGGAVVRGTGSYVVCASPMFGKADYGVSAGGLPNAQESRTGTWRLYNPWIYSEQAGDKLSSFYLADKPSIRLWVYSVNDLATVAAGSAGYNSLTPTACVSLPLPLDTLLVSAMVFDNTSGRMYVAVDLGIDQSFPAMVVYQCNKWS